MNNSNSGDMISSITRKIRITGDAADRMNLNNLYFRNFLLNPEHLPFFVITSYGYYVERWHSKVKSFQEKRKSINLARQQGRHCISLRAVWCTYKRKSNGCRESQMPIIPMKLGNACRGKGLMPCGLSREISAFAQEKRRNSCKQKLIG